MTDRDAALKALGAAAARWTQHPSDTTQFARDWRQAMALGGFSIRAHEVSEGLLIRIESAQAFGGGESCSFSATEIQAAFGQLFEKLKTAK